MYIYNKISSKVCMNYKITNYEIATMTNNEILYILTEFIALF